MRSLLFTSILVLLYLSAYSQQWYTDFQSAKELAKLNDRNIVLVFSGSDWCAPCMKLEKTIWESEVFKKYSEEHFVLVKADFPRRGKNKLSKEQEAMNKQLAEVYNKQGQFPKVLVLDYEGKVLGVTGYKKLKPEKYIEILSSF